MGKFKTISRHLCLCFVLLYSGRLCPLPKSSHFLENLIAQTNVSPKKAFYIKHIHVHADIPFSRDELLYLTDMREDTHTTLEKITAGYKHLKMKQRFHTIDVTIQDQTLTWHLKATWIFKEVKVTGILFGKHRYENAYLQHPGEVFDLALHKESMAIIKQLLYKRGYVNCVLTDEITYNTKRKHMCVKITIKKGKVSKIKRIEVTPQSPLTRKVKTLLHQQLAQKPFSQKLIEKARDAAKEYLIKKGIQRPIVRLNTCEKHKRHVFLTFEVLLHHRLSLTYTGNTFFSSTYLQDTYIDTEKPAWLLDPHIIAEQILHDYYKHGFWKTKIKLKKTGTNAYLCTIHEGPRTQIDTVIVIDAETKREERNKFFFTKFLDQAYYNEPLLQQCLENVKRFYVEHGFWDFSIQSIDTQHNTIRIVIKKGAQRFLKAIDVPDTRLASTAFFAEELKKVGQPFNPTWLANQRLYIIDHYQSQGYWYVDAHPTFTSDPHVAVSWDIDHKEKVTFDKIILQGNTRFPFKKILAYMQCKEGDLWDKKKLDYSRKKLKKLGIFKHIELRPKKLSNHTGKKPIVLVLVDDDPFELKLRAGYFLTSKNFLLKRESTYKAGCSLIIKNPLNIADNIELNTNVTRFEKDACFEYSMPRFFSHTAASNIKAYYHDYTHPLEVGKSDSAYQALQKGFLFGIKKEYKPFCFWGLNIGNEWIKTRKTKGTLNLNPKLINKTVPYIFVEPNLFIDKLDDKLQTTRGYLTFGSLKIMVPEKHSGALYKIMLEHARFFPITTNVVLASRIRFGHIFYRHFNLIQPIERFFLGGPYSVRGYTKDTVPPLGRSGSNYTIQGGSSMVNGNIELRFPLIKSFGGVIFQDIGVLSQSGFAGFKKRWYPTSGCGLRYKTPIGALRFDIGWKWKQSFPKEPSYAWYLTLGQAF